jgi:CheY-like chemotaxis protein
MRLKTLNLLLVDDDPDQLDLLSLCLTSEGANVLIARTIAAALARSTAARIDLLLCNLLLSDGDGCELLQRLRERPESSNLPAIALTAVPDRVHLLPCGFDRLALIPVDLRDLVDSIARLAKLLH